MQNESEDETAGGKQAGNKKKWSGKKHGAARFGEGVVTEEGAKGAEKEAKGSKWNGHLERYRGSHGGGDVSGNGGEGTGAGDMVMIVRRFGNAGVGTAGIVEKGAVEVWAGKLVVLSGLVRGVSHVWTRYDGCIARGAGKDWIFKLGLKNPLCC